MRVCHVITRLIIGGAQENTIASVLGMKEDPDCQVQLLSGPTTGPEGSLESLFDSTPETLQIVPHLVRPVNPIKDIQCLIHLTRLFKSNPPDIVHTHSGKAGILGRFAAHLAKVPLIIHSIHGPSFGAFQGPLPNLIFTRAEKSAGKVTDHFVVVAHAMMRQYLEAGIGRPECYTRIFSGFDLQPFLNAKPDLVLRKKLGLKEHHIVIGKIARLFKLKGHDDLIDAATSITARQPDVRFLLIGDGMWRSRLEGRIHDLGLTEFFIFTGLLRPDEVPAHIGIMDLLVHLSTREGLPRALPQAMAAGKAVVAYDCDGAGEVCLDQETGFLVHPGDLSALQTAINQLCSNKPMRDSMGQKGRAFVEKHFHVDEMVLALRTLYRRLMKEKNLRNLKT